MAWLVGAKESRAYVLLKKNQNPVFAGPEGLEQLILINY